MIVDLVALHIFTSQNQIKGRKTPFPIKTTTIKLKYLGVNETKNVQNP